MPNAICGSARHNPCSGSKGLVIYRSFSNPLCREHPMLKLNARRALGSDPMPNETRLHFTKLSG